MSASLANVVSLATTPISEASPAGESVRLDAGFETLRATIEKMYTEGAAGVDWKKVVSLSSDILQTKSKDLLVASYLCCGLLYLDGYQGLAEGLDAVHQMMVAHWDGLFPERAKARVSAVTWLSERVGAAVAQREGKAADLPTLQTCVEKINAIDSLLGEKLGGDAPSLREFSRALEEALGKIDVPAAPPPPRDVPAGGGIVEAPSSPPAPVDDLTTPEGIEAALGRLLSSALEVGRAQRRAVPQDPLAYRLIRMSLWSQVKALPENTDGATMIPFPGDVAALTDHFEGMIAGSQWPELLEEAESQFEQMALWFDVQRFASMAMQGMGGGYDSARAAVREDLASFVRRLPGVLDLKFAEGAAFASDATKAWVRAEVLAAAGGDAGGEMGRAAVADAADKAFDEALESARELSKRRRMPDALAVLSAAADSSGSRRQRFARRLAIARFLAEGREHRLAVAVLESLDDEIRRFNLEEWDPALSMDAVRLHLQCHRQAAGGGWEGSPEAIRKEETLFARLAKVDTSAALRMQRKS